MENCSTTISPNYTNDQALKIVGVYQPPGKTHPDCKEALGMVQRDNNSKNGTTKGAGDLKISTSKEIVRKLARAAITVGCFRPRPDDA